MLVLPSGVRCCIHVNVVLSCGYVHVSCPHVSCPHVSCPHVSCPHVDWDFPFETREFPNSTRVCKSLPGIDD